MATSNSSNYNQTRNEIISDALQLLGVIGANDTAATNDITFCSNMLNKMIKGWQAKGIHLWKESEAIIPLISGQSKYTLASSGGDKAGDNAVETTLSAAASASATVLTLTSTTGMTAADNIVIALDAGTLHTTTIVSVDSTTQVTITAGLASAAASGNNVVSYTTALNRPIKILNCRYHYSTGLERLMRTMGRTEYMSIPTKTSTSSPSTCYYYSPQLNNGLLYVWPIPNTTNDSLHVSYIKTIEDFDNSTDNADFPQEWLDCITYNLAVQVAPAYGLTLSKVNPDVLSIAQNMLAEIQAWDVQDGSIRITPNHRFDD